MEVPLILTIRGAIIQKIWSQILLVSIYTAVLVYISNYVWEIIFPQTLVPVLGVVTGLLLVFRTQTSYDRWWEGRKLWSTMTFNIRTLTRCIWLMVKKKEDEKKNENQEEDIEVKDSTIIIEKLTAINTILAFAYATKNYLRGKHSYEKGILKDLINPIPEFAPKGFFEKPKKETPTGLTCCWRNSDTSTPEEDGSACNHKIKESSKHDIKAKYEEGFPPNIPLELSYYLASYIENVRARGLAPDYISDMKSALNNLVECLGGLERISRTPIPLAYSVHLAHATWLFILALPFQLIGTLNWFTIPAVALAAFALLGILGIGLEIQNPFEDEYNDLPLNEFCNVLHEEILLILGHPMPIPQDWLLSPKNHPFGTSDHIKRFQLPASELVQFPENILRGALEEGAKTILIRRQLYKEKKKEIKKKRKANRKSGTVPSPGAVTEGENEELVP